MPVHAPCLTSGRDQDSLIKESTKEIISPVSTCINFLGGK